MLRPLLSELKIEVEIRTKSNLLIKDGRYTRDTKADWCTKEEREKAPDFLFVSRSDEGLLQTLARDPTPAHLNTLDYYIPGASVRGSWRSHLEKVLRSLDAESAVCDPMATNEADAHRPDRACSTSLVNKAAPPPEHAYRDSCPVCKLFGSTAHGSRLSFSDGKKTAGTARMADNVAISRQTGSVISPFKSVVLHQAVFSVEIRLRNFELWQAGLLGHLFDDLKGGRVPLGSGKNKGFGAIEAKATSMTVSYYGRAPAGKKLWGLSSLLNDAARSAHYGLFAEVPVEIADICGDVQPGAMWRSDLAIRNADKFWELVKPRFSEAVWKSLPGRRAAAG